MTMTCDHVSERLGDLVDGTLDDNEATALGHHLETCTPCRRELETERELRAATHALPPAVEPDRDLWAGVAARIQSGRVVRGRFGWLSAGPVRRFAAAAAAAAVLVATMTAAYFAGLHRADPRGTESGPSQLPAAAVTAHLEAGRDLARIRDDLMERLEERRHELSPETWSVVIENLDVIARSIARIEVALDDHPYDSRLNHHLAAAYRLEIDLLQRATRLPAEI